MKKALLVLSALVLTYLLFSFVAWDLTWFIGDSESKLIYVLRIGYIAVSSWLSYAFLTDIEGEKEDQIHTKNDSPCIPGDDSIPLSKALFQIADDKFKLSEENEALKNQIRELKIDNKELEQSRDDLELSREDPRL
jgi:hypothetical protein